MVCAYMSACVQRPEEGVALPEAGVRDSWSALMCVLGTEVRSSA